MTASSADIPTNKPFPRRASFSAKPPSILILPPRQGTSIGDEKSSVCGMSPKQSIFEDKGLSAQCIKDISECLSPRALRFSKAIHEQTEKARRRFEARRVFNVYVLSFHVVLIAEACMQWQATSSRIPLYPSAHVRTRDRKRGKCFSGWPIFARIRRGCSNLGRTSNSPASNAIRP